MANLRAGSTIGGSPLVSKDDLETMLENYVPVSDYTTPQIHYTTSGITPKNGDLYINLNPAVPEIFIYAKGAWRKIFPAQWV